MTASAKFQVSHKIGRCPACRDFVWADVDVTVRIPQPRIDEHGRPAATANPSCVGATIQAHRCAGQGDS